MGFGRIIGGALEGAGTGIAEMAASKELERRAAALENLRSQNTSREQTERAQLTDWADSRSLTRKTNAEILITEQEGKNRLRVEETRAAATAAEKEADRQHDIRMTQLKGKEERLTVQARAAIEGGQVKTTAVAENGEIIIITNGGKTIATGQIATEKDRYAGRSDSGSGSVLDEVRGGATPAPAASSAPPKPQATSPAKAQAAANKVYEPPYIDGAYRIMLDKDAEAFVNNPANKGKKFVGPDGGTYIVK